MKKNREIKSQAKQDLFDAFWEFYRTKRIEKITVKEITQKAGYNRSTFYDYFIDIYDILDQFENTLIPSLHELPPTSIKTNHIGMPLESFIELFEQQKQYYSVLLSDHGDPAFATKLKDSIKPLLKDTITDNNNYTEIELDFILEYILSAMISIMSYWFKNDKLLPVEKLIPLMSDVIENGITQLFES